MVKKNNGQSLLEVLIALSVIILVLTALVRVVTISIRSTDYSRHSSMATTYATQAMEKIRSFRDTTAWTEFATLPDSTRLFYGDNITFNEYKNGNVCTGSASNFTTYSSYLIDGIFLRCATSLRNYTGTEVTNIKITVTVYWLENDDVKNAELVSYFYNWK